MKDVWKAANGSDVTLHRHGVRRKWAHDFFLTHVPEGRHVAATGGMLSEPALATQDEPFVRQVVTAIQRFVFGDEGDAAAKIPPQPATDAEVDGWLGEMTWSRMSTWLESVKPPSPPSTEAPGSDFVVVGGTRHEVPGLRCVSLDEPGSLSFPRDVRKGYSRWGTELASAHVLAVVHWDAALSAKSAFGILKSRGYASCFGVDNPDPKTGEAPVWQWLDPGIHRGAHAGGRANKTAFASFDMSNAVYPKYAGLYEKVCGGRKRPVIQVPVHSTEDKVLLGMYRGQVVALLRVLKTLAKIRGSVLSFPRGNDGLPVHRAFPGMWEPSFRGAVTHLHITSGKWDVAGLEHQILVLLLTDPALAAEFPELVTEYDLGASRWQDWLSARKATWIWPEIGW